MTNGVHGAVTQALDEATIASFQGLVGGGILGVASREVDSPPSPNQSFRLYKPLTEAAEEYREWAEHPELRVYTGIPELDSR